jgi:hypothetical protein
MMKSKRLLWAIALLLSPAFPLALVAGAPASASAGGAGFHVVESLGCNNPSFCGSLQLSSFRGTAQLNSDGTASGQLTAAGLVQGSGPGAGAQHFAVDVADLGGQPGWFVGPNGDFFITNETDTFTGRSVGPPLTVFDTFPPYPHDLGIPAAPGHYNTTELFGFTPPPGVTFQIQVTQLPG